MRRLNKLVVEYTTRPPYSSDSSATDCNLVKRFDRAWSEKIFRDAADAHVSSPLEKNPSAEIETNGIYVDKKSFILNVVPFTQSGDTKSGTHSETVINNHYRVSVYVFRSSSLTRAIGYRC